METWIFSFLQVIQRMENPMSKSSIRVYICDGLACDNGKNCYIRGGECTHTSNEDHSIKKRLGDDFPPTTFVEIGDGMAEQIYLPAVLLGYIDGEKSQNLPAV